MSALGKYANDPRVTSSGDGYTVEHDGTAYHVLNSKALGWGVFVGPNLDIAPIEDGGFAIGADGPEPWIDAIFATKG